MAQRAADLNQQPDQRGRRALIEIGPALWEAFFGHVSEARGLATVAADLSTDRDVEYGAAFALALSGESSRSGALAKDLDTRFPADSAVQFIYLPAIRALLALNDDSNVGGASKAIELLQLARPYDRGIPPSIAPMFIGPLYRSMCVVWPTWPHTDPTKPPRSSRRFSITAGSLSAIRFTRWRTCSSAER